jgi:hypothetical protein
MALQGDMIQFCQLTSPAHFICADDDEDDEDEGWGMVRTPWLPPPPSQPDEVEQWARAMFTDPNASSSSAVLTGVVVGSPPTGSGMMSIDRIRSMFGKS